MGSKTPLEPLSTEEWDKDTLGYIVTFTVDDGVYPFSIGNTEKEAKDRAVKNAFRLTKAFSNITALMNALGLIHLGESTMVPIKGSGKFAKVSVTLCEHKLVVYSERYGLNRLKVAYDPFSFTPLLRYAGLVTKDLNTMNKMGLALRRIGNDRRVSIPAPAHFEGGRRNRNK
jgi:hypothetical protein